MISDNLAEGGLGILLNDFQTILDFWYYMLHFSGMCFQRRFTQYLLKVSTYIQKVTLKNYVENAEFIKFTLFLQFFC